MNQIAAKAPLVTETVIAHTDPVACSGTGGALGHPTVYLTFAGKSEVRCPYCSRLFTLSPDAKTGHGH